MPHWNCGFIDGAQRIANIFLAQLFKQTITVHKLLHVKRFHSCYGVRIQGVAQRAK